MGIANGIVSEPWTEADRERLRTMIAAGSSTTDAALALGRTPGATQAMAHKMGLRTWGSVPVRTREAIVEHAKMGWATSRIARRFGVPAQAVDAWTGRCAR